MTLIKFLGITFITLGGLVVGQIAPRLLIRSDLERFFGVEGPSIQYAGIAHNTLHHAFCSGGPGVFVCTAVRITDVMFVNPGLGMESLRTPKGCAYPYKATAKLYSWFGIPIQKININCSFGTTFEKQRFF